MYVPTPSRYRMTRASFDVISVFGCIGAVALPGPAFAAVLARRGYSAVSVRNQLVRMVDRGLLRREKAGRVSIYHRAPALGGEFDLYSGAAEPDGFDGSFPALLVTIPEYRRGDRDRVLHVARHCGYRTLRPGVLISVRGRAEELRERLQHAVGDRDGIDHCRIAPESDAQARDWARHAFTTSEDRGAVGRLEERYRELGQDPAPTHARYFDLFYDAAMLIEDTEVLPEMLRGQDGDVGLRARRLMGTLVEFWATAFAGEQVSEVLSLPGGSLVQWDEVFWARVGQPVPGATR
jgi:phenylacetic acid degradation operon negative regulatory protein